MALWFRIKGPRGHTWRIYHGTPAEHPALTQGLPRGSYDSREGDDVDFAGVTIFGDRDIFVNSEEPWREHDETCLHELMHAAARGDPATDYSRKAEEQVIRSISPRLFPMLKQMGLRWPNKPARK